MTGLDHVLIAVPDLEAAAREVERRHGLASVEGGKPIGVLTRTDLLEYLAHRR
jgi:Glyoxalase-like domain/CBS domain